MIQINENTVYRITKCLIILNFYLFICVHNLKFFILNLSTVFFLHYLFIAIVAKDKTKFYKSRSEVIFDIFLSKFSVYF